MKRVGVVGLGKLGAPLAALLAAKGFDTVGIDRNPAVVQNINAGRAPVEEPGLQELIDRARGRLRASGDFAEVAGAEATFILVPTPSGDSGAFSNAFVLDAVREVAAALSHGPGYHVVAIVSTVMPGSTGGEIRAALERHSGRRAGHDIGLCYNPEFVALGSVIRNLLEPDMILIGESDPRAGAVLGDIYSHLCDNRPAIERMSLVNAELTKIAVNTYVTTKISYANMLAELCERLPGGDVSVVTRALGRDSRIGPRYLSGAVGYGGPCFPRDNVAFIELARSLGARADIARATHDLNEHQVDRLAAMVGELVAPPAVVGILGLSYKPDTGIIECSTGVALARRLAQRGFGVAMFDPMALQAASSALEGIAAPAPSAAACAERSDLLVLATAWPSFRDLPPQALQRPHRRLPVIDCWRLLDPERFRNVADLIYIGQAPSSVHAEAAAARQA